ncbi:MAG: endo-1,4-beta-xylanase [Planctomycetes bacterium]|nr:endo-1,4-beta-xylanase [Planctomycetota bacterium]
MRDGAGLGMLAAAFCLASAASGRGEEPPVPEGRRLREIVRANYREGSVLVGATIGAQDLAREPGVVLDREFSYVTPENDYKQQVVRADPKAWNWAPADAWVKPVADRGKVLRMHCPIGPQCSTWVKDDARTAAELEAELSLFLETICRRYNGKAGYRYMDVVNETVSNGAWHRDGPGTAKWECPWFRIGQDTDRNRTPLFIRMAFETAQKHAPDVRFVFNHHEDPSRADSWKLVKETVAYLQERKLRVDAVGWQAHVDAGWDTPQNLAKLGELIDWAHERKLEFHVTEASVWLKKGQAEEDLAAQARTYRAVLKALLDRRKTGVVAWNTWHVTDARGWHVEWLPSLFDANYRAKPAYFAVQAELEAHKD